jgi:hypothetical protein
MTLLTQQKLQFPRPATFAVLDLQVHELVIGGPNRGSMVAIHVRADLTFAGSTEVPLLAKSYTDLLTYTSLLQLLWLAVLVPAAEKALLLYIPC